MEKDDAGSLVQKVAEAIRTAHVNQAIERLARQDIQADRVQAALDVARIEPPRSSAILIFALVEDIMLDCFKEHFNPNVAGGWNDVIKGGGLLATASDRITLLELLYWIKPRTSADLRLMKSIRNRFAHHAEVHDFSDKKISGWVTTMHPHEKPALAVLPEFSELKLGIRELYLVRSVGTIVNLITDLKIGPIATQEKVHPSELYGGTFDDQPENLKNALRFQAAMMLKMLPEGLTS